MKKYLIVLFIAVFSLSILAQKKEQEKKPTQTGQADAERLAKETFSAHGGEKLKKLNTLSILGSVDVTASSFTLPATFATIFSGDKYRLEINSQMVNFKQVFDGEQTFTSPQRGFNLPPVNRLGLPLLQHLGDEGFVVSALLDKKTDGFRITSPEGYYSDFYINKKTNQIKKYEAKYMVEGREVSTLVEIDKFEDKDGVIIPSKYAQRFEFGQMTVYAQFKAKEIKVNEEVADKVFVLE
ncbi:MAG: hypothetical protein M3405_14215 [Acidobacteriota bacterium]|jgi:hypothetical protein|nr:hypothetical protein [Acidobacteriota bacterium]